MTIPRTSRSAARLAAALLLLLLLLTGLPARAHEGGPGLRLVPNRALPGEQITVDGYNLGTDLTVALVLEKDGLRQPLGQALCDGHGDFTTRLALPAGLEHGLYTLSALDTSAPGLEQVMASAQLYAGPPPADNLIPTLLLGAAALLAVALFGVLRLLKR